MNLICTEAVFVSIKAILLCRSSKRKWQGLRLQMYFKILVSTGVNINLRKMQVVIISNKAFSSCRIVAICNNKSLLLR